MEISKLRIGIIGGMGPAAGNYFASLLTDKFAARKDQDHPVVINYSNPKIPDRTMFMQGNGESPVPEIVDTAKKLQTLGVDILCIPCNTAHAPSIFDQVKSQVNMPVLNMVNLTIDRIVEEKPEVKTIGILGTSGTILGNAYGIASDKNGLICKYPSESEQSKIMEIIYSIKAVGVDSKDGLKLKSVMNSFGDDVDLFILACTELSLLSKHLGEAPYIDSLEVLADSALLYTD